MNIEKMKFFIYLVEKKRTGTPAEIAQKLAVSERTVYNYALTLKNELNAPIEFNPFRRTYEFEKAGKLVWEWDTSKIKAQKN
jgi:predicted DNA-binding transcriptional regulator YafY